MTEPYIEAGEHFNEHERTEAAYERELEKAQQKIMEVVDSDDNQPLDELITYFYNKCETDDIRLINNVIRDAFRQVKEKEVTSAAKLWDRMAEIIAADEFEKRKPTSVGGDV